MNRILDTLDILAKREEDLHALMLSATDQMAQQEQSVRAAIENLEARINAVQEDQKTNSESAIEKAVAISNQYTEYQNLVTRVRETVSRTLPPDATVIMVSKGDNELLKLEGRNAWHFPQNEKGVYAGYYPGTSAEAIAQLETLRKKGGQYIVFPQTALWWLEHYDEFKQHLDSKYKMIDGRDDTCLIYSVAKPAARACPPKRRQAGYKPMVARRRASGCRAPIKVRNKAKA